MPLRPEGAQISIGGNALFVDDIKQTFVIQQIERDEFKHQRQRTVLEDSGIAPILITKFAGGFAQLSYTCANVTVRPTIPDDVNIFNIYQRWQILRYTVTGAPSLVSSVGSVYSIFQVHKVYLGVLDTHYAIAKGDVSIQELETLQTDSIFNTIQTTGLTVSSNSIGTLTNCLISNFTIDYAYEIPLNSAGTSNTLYQSWSATIDQWFLVGA